MARKIGPGTDVPLASSVTQNAANGHSLGNVLRLTLPVPPSTNALYLTRGRKRIKSPAYRQWQTVAGQMLQRQRQGCIGGPWHCTITVPAGTRRDADNFAKAILDLLVKHGVVADDRYCTRLTVQKDGAFANTVLINIQPAPASAPDAGIVNRAEETRNA